MLDKRGIRQTLRAVLQGVITAAGLDWDKQMAWENRVFIPPALDDDPKKSLWVRETYLKGIEQQLAYGYVEETSMMQYDVFIPAGGGTEEAEDLAKAIGDAFKPGTGLTSTGMSGVTAATPSDASGNPIQISLIRSEQLKGTAAFGDSAWFCIPVRITFRAYGTV